MKFLRKDQPTQYAVHADRPLTNLSVAVLQGDDSFVVPQVFPVIGVQKQSDTYYTYPKGMFLRDQMAKRADGTLAQEIGYSVSTDNYRCDVWAIAHRIGDQRRANTDAPLAPDREAMMLLTKQRMIRQDREWGANYFTTGIWARDRTGVASGPTGLQFLRFDVGGSTPIELIDEEKTLMVARSGFEPNTLVMDRKTWGVLRNHASVVDRIKYTGSSENPAKVELMALAALFGVPKIIVAKSIYNSAVEGQADSIGFIHGTGMLLLYVAPSAGLMTPTAGLTFNWDGLMSGAGVGGQAITRWRDQPRRSDVIELESAFDMKVVATELGTFFATPVS